MAFFPWRRLLLCLLQRKSTDKIHCLGKIMQKTQCSSSEAQLRNHNCVVAGLQLRLSIDPITQSCLWLKNKSCCFIIFIFVEKWKLLPNGHIHDSSSISCRRNVVALHLCKSKKHQGSFWAWETSSSKNFLKFMLQCMMPDRQIKKNMLFTWIIFLKNYDFIF